MKDYYQILGIPPTASEEQIRKVYRKLAQIYHPDTTVLDKLHAHQKFQELSIAYEVLSDPLKRTDYDRLLQKDTETESSTETLPPKPVISTSEIDFGSVPIGQSSTQIFQVDNAGGPVQTMNLTVGQDNGWFTVHLGKPFSENQPYPLDIEVTVDTQKLVAGHDYAGWLEVDFDGVTAIVEVRLTVTSRPMPHVEPTSLDFGKLAIGETQTMTFLVNNLGGPVSRMIDFNLSEKNSWFRVTKYNRASTVQPFPVEVEVTVNTRSLDEDRAYEGWIEVSLDNITTRVFLYLYVLPSPKPEVKLQVSLYVTLQKHQEGVWSVAFSPNGEALASGGDDNQLWLWEEKNSWQPRSPKFWSLRQRIKLGAVASIWSVAFSPDAQLLACATWEKILLWELASTWKIWEINITKQHHPHSVTFSPDGQLVAGDGDHAEIWLWEVVKRQNVKRLRGHLGEIRAVVFAPDGELLASGSEDGTIRLWQVAAGREVKQLKGHSGAVTSVAFSPDGRLLASAGSFHFTGGVRHKDLTVRLWDVESGQEIRRLTGHTKSVESVTFHPQGQMVVSSSVDGTIRFWDVQSGHEVYRKEGFTKSISSLAFRPDGQILAAGGWDSTIRLYHIH